jgi:hypothetical protein
MDSKEVKLLVKKIGLAVVSFVVILIVEFLVNRPPSGDG